MPEMRPFGSKDFTEESLKDIERLVVLFESPWCHGCSAVEKMIQGLSDEEAKACIWGKVDISIQQDLALRFGVISVPTLLVFHHGEVTKRLSGRISKEKLLSVSI